MSPLPHALDPGSALAHRLRDRSPAVFLDYDGTLSPIVSRPELAVMPDATRDAVRRLAARCTVAVVSGRDREDVRALVGLDGIIYAGSHGFDIAGPDGLELEHEEGARARPLLERAAAELERAVAPFEGAWVERKKFATAVHYRQVAEKQHEALIRAAAGVTHRHPDLRRTGGKRVIELRPRIDWDKGRAVLWLLDALKLGGDEVCPIYVGDDETDEDAFRALGERGVGVLVAESDRPTAAACRLNDPGEVCTLLEWLAARTGEA